MRNSSFAVGLVLALVAGTPVHAADESDSTVVIEEGSHRWRLPPDWPIEERGGIRGPIPTEEYLYRKFSAVEKQLRDLEQRVSGLDVRLRVIEEDLKGNQKRGLRSN